MLRFSIRAFASHERGSVAMIFSISSVALFALAGLSITLGMLTHEHAAQQTALDNAVIAGASVKSGSDEERIAVATAAFQANLKQLGFTSAKNKSSPATFRNEGDVLTGQAEATVKNLFAGIIGGEYLSMRVDAAARASAGDPVCVLALDTVSPRGFEVYGSSQFTARNCAVQANSNDRAGLKQFGKAEARAKQFGVSGGYTGSGFYPKPSTGVDEITDPLASIPFPSTEGCINAASKLTRAPAILDPGTYCEGLNIKAGSEVILKPGIYIMLNGPFRVDSNSTVTGEEVMIAFTGRNSTLYLGSGAEMILTSPKFGTYTNIQFFQDPRSSQDEWVTLIGGIKLTFDGIMYFPTQDVWLAGGSTIEAKSPNYIFVVEKLWIQDNASVEIWQENSRDLHVDHQQEYLSTTAHLIR